MTNQTMLCLDCGFQSQQGQPVCPKDGRQLVSNIVSHYELVDRVSSDLDTVTYSARHLDQERPSLKITLRPRTDAEAAEEFIQYARQTAKMSAPNGGTLDVGLTDDGTYMFFVFDPNNKDELQNPTIEHQILLIDAVSELTAHERD